MRKSLLRASIASLAAACLFTTIGQVEAAATQTYNITISDSGFTPNSITAVVNRPVNIYVTNSGTKTHQFSIPNYYIFTQNLLPHRSSTVGFTPNQAGRFTIMSDPSGKNQPEFSGFLIVTDQK